MSIPTVTENRGIRNIRFQFRRQGRIHAAPCYEVIPYTPGESLYTLVSGETYCGKNIPIGTGGWGYGGKFCPTCLPHLPIDIETRRIR
jgi:hypothetical protein